MGGHSARDADGAKRKRDRAFPGLNPELAAVNGDGTAGRQASANTPESDAEMAAEFAAPDAKPHGRRRDDETPKPGGLRPEPDKASDAGRAMGLFALAIAIASLFAWPLPLGLAAAVFGWFSFREGARGLGIWAVTIGLVAALSQFVLIPIQAALS